MDADRSKRLQIFADWVGKHVTGDEKGESQIFLDRLFQGFGHKGVFEVGGKPEFRVLKSKEDGGGTSFADLVWKPWVLIEMKRRGEDLSKHYRQAFDYWTRLVPGRPRYVVLCNFDELWVYDFETQMDTPVDRVTIRELPGRYGPLAFLFPTHEKPTFGNDQEAVTREAADRLATCFNKLVTRGVDRAEAQRFVLQFLVALFSEDIGLLEKYFVAKLIDECKAPADAYDLLGGLFVEMNTPGKTKGGRYKGVDYFNGGLFKEPVRLELYPDEIAQLREAAKSNWSQVRPEIFGTLFEHSCGDIDGERRKFGIHFTSVVDIMKIVSPTIVEPWRNLIENASTQKQLRALLTRMHEYHVLDPACGSGNFLYLAYRELKRLEARIYERLAAITRRKEDAAQVRFGFVTARQFYGLDINEFAIELAKVTMMIARKLSIDELHVSEPALPLDNLDSNFVAGDALVDKLGNPVNWPTADVIIGNPPFTGAKRLKPERGSEYVNAVRRAYPQVPAMADYCVYWIRKSHDQLPECTRSDSVAGRAGLVGTQNIRNNQSRVGGLDYVVQSGKIVEAVDNQPWSGEANVSVSIANWIKLKGESIRRNDVDPELLSRKPRLWFKVDPGPGTQKRRLRRSGSGVKAYELAYRDVETINSALSDRTDLSPAQRLACNRDPQRSFQGVNSYSGFRLNSRDARILLNKDPANAHVVKPYMTGNDMIANGKPIRWIVDFGTLGQFDARKYAAPFEWVESSVLPSVQKSASKAKGTDMAQSRQEHLERWWQHWNVRVEMREQFKALTRYLAISRTTKRQILCFISTKVLPDCQLQTFAFEDDYSFGVLASSSHWQWFFANCSKQTERPRYSARSVFETFGWPQRPSMKQVKAVSEAGRNVRAVQSEALQKIKGGLRAVYRTLELPGKNPLKDAHAALDAAVLAGYGFSAKKDLLAQLLALNLDVAARIERGETVTAPGIPPDYPKPDELVTDDCIRPE